MTAPVKVVKLPKSEQGNDTNDHRDDETYLDKLKPEPPANPLDVFVLNGESEAIEVELGEYTSNDDMEPIVYWTPD